MLLVCLRNITVQIYYYYLIGLKPIVLNDIHTLQLCNLCWLYWAVNVQANCNCTLWNRGFVIYMLENYNWQLVWQEFHVFQFLV